MAKFTKLIDAQKRGHVSAQGALGAFITPARERERLLATLTFPDSDVILGCRFSDVELETILLKNNAEYIRRGHVSGTKSDEDSPLTVQRFGWACLKNGWSIVPQTRDGGERKPAPTPVASAKSASHRAPTEAFLPTKWRERRHSLHEFLGLQRYWRVNLALQCCAASGHIRVLDVDCRDADTALWVMQLAFEVLGATPFIRYGAKPKVQLLYRVEGAEDIKLQRFTIEIAKADGTPDRDEDGKPVNAVEWLAEGSMFTAYGLHWKTDKSFEWPELHPAIAGPELAPVATKAKLREFTNRIQQIRPIKGAVANSNPHGGKAVVIEFDRFANGRIWTPKSISGDFTVDKDGYVVDGGESWLTALAWALCAGNALGLQRLYGLLEDHLVTRAERALGKHHRSSGSLSSPERIGRTARQKLRTAADKWLDSIDQFIRTGRYNDRCVPWTIMEDGSRPIAQRIAGSPRPIDGSLDWIPQETCPVEALAESMPRAKTSIAKLTTEQIFANKAARALIEDPAEHRRIGNEVSDKVRSGIRGFLDAVPEDLADTPISEIPLHIMRAPTGAGKTAGTAGQLAGWCAENPRQNVQGAVHMVVATHANADELMLKAEAEGMYTGSSWSEAEIDEFEEMARAQGVKIVRFQGRKAAGCQRQEELEMLSSRGISVSGLCGARVPTESETEADLLRRHGEKVPTEEVLCPFRENGTCGYYNQFADLQDTDVVVLTHAYLTQNQLPKALQEPRAVIIDESVTYSILQARFMPIAALEAERKLPYITKSDRAERPGMSVEDISAELYGERAQACKLALATLAKPTEKERDLATAFLAHPHGRAWIKSAKLVCDRSHTSDRAINPNLSIDAVAEIASKPVADDLLLEKKLWSLVEERITFLEAGIAKGDHDARFQVIHHLPNKRGEPAPHLRMSWRRTPNWDATPTLLLDASADPAIVQKIWGREPTVIEVNAPMHARTIASIDQTLSNASFIPRFDATSEEIERCAANIQKARSLITTTAAVYGYGRVLVGTTMKVREVLTAGGWTPPPNVDFVHFGALRGLDFAKFHVAAISLGRSEMPIHIIDAYAAALTYDDAEPEHPHDRLGTGLTAECKPLIREKGKRVIKMRTGQDVSHAVPQMPAKVIKDRFGNKKPTPPGGSSPKTWAQRLEEAWREEEIRQFVGRLRPVFRGIARAADGTPIQVEAPVWIVVGKILPSDIIVDEIVDLDSLLKPAPLYEIARLNNGILSSTIAENDPLTSQILNGRTLGELTAEVLPSSKLDNRTVLRLLSAASIVKHKNAGGKIQNSMIFPAWFEPGEDLGQAVREVAASIGQALEIISVAPAKRAPIGVAAGKIDKLDLAMGGLVVAVEAELSLRELWSYMPIDKRPLLTETEVRLLRGETVCGRSLRDTVPEPEPGLGDPDINWSSETELA